MQLFRSPCLYVRESEPLGEQRRDTLLHSWSPRSGSHSSSLLSAYFSPVVKIKTLMSHVCLGVKIRTGSEATKFPAAFSIF